MADNKGDPPAQEPISEWLGETLWASRDRNSAPVRFPALAARLGRARWWLANRVGDLIFERGLETSGDVFRAQHFHPDRVWYSASGWRYLPRAMKGLAVAPTDVFLDYGCGKGRVLLQAAQHPFARVIGIEISPELSEIARRNLQRRRAGLVCGNVEIVTADAAEWEVPDDVTFAYLYYPFVGETFERVVGRIVASLDRSPRRFVLIYARPSLEHVVLATGRFRLVRKMRVLQHYARDWLAIYEAAYP